MSASRFIVYSLIALAGFAAGIAVEHGKPWKHWRHVAKPEPEDASKIVAAQRVTEGGEVRFTKELDSTLLPLQLTGYRLAAKLPVAKFAGGIATIGNKVIVVDRLGAVFAWQEGEVSRLPFPELPTNFAVFVQHTALNDENFRVHDAEYLPEENALAVSHEWYDPAAQQTRLTISSIGIDAASLQPRGEWKTLWRGDMAPNGKPPASPGGGRMVTDHAGHLYFTTIDYIPDDVGHPQPDPAQDPKSTFGKIFRLELASGKTEMVSLGHRNPQGLVLTHAGELLSAEHGPAGGDELNLITPGTNYGFPNVTLGTEYQTYGWPSTAPVGRHDGFTPPIFAWVPSVATCNLIELHGFHPRWEGDLLVASLKGNSLYRLRREGDRVLYSEPIWIGERIRDLAQLEDGRIVLWTDNANLLFLAVDDAKLQANRKVPDTSTPPVMATCMTCHHFGPTNPSHLAPSLSRVFGRAVASDDFARYTPALKAAGGVWDAARLRAFLSDPSQFAPGTTMPKPGLSERDLAAVIDVLQSPVAK